MYHLDKRSHRHKKALIRLAWFLSLVSVAFVVYWLFTLRITPHQNVRNAAPFSTAYSPGKQRMQTIEKNEFTLQLMSSWKEFPVTVNVHIPKYVFRDEQNSRTLDIFIDELPTDFAINKAIVVSANGNGLAYETVSDNCITFTELSKKDPRMGTAPAKWGGVDFTCDMANSARAVVGTISKDSFNGVRFETAAGTARAFFMAYTDNNITPDYTALYQILSSVRFK
ncbi:hypothetical protein JNM87_00165 [Candidatus Saccharibacteria bacterium]|nr:hypothetical protein [Candidatus Saccharibacteria bacterium]